MHYRELKIPGAWEITPRQFGDDRGVFYEWFKQPTFTDASGRPLELAQANCSVSAAGVLRSDPWRETIVTGGDQDIDGVDTSAVAPTFGLVMAGLAAMMIAAFSPFLLAKLLSTDPAASTGEARGAVGGSMNTAKSSVKSATCACRLSALSDVPASTLIRSGGGVWLRYCSVPAA